MGLEDKKRIRSSLLELLKEFIRICDKYGLRYYMGGGTMLGAVRHKGFIPWDDDIDIDMPRPDYQKFLEIADKEISDKPNYIVQSCFKGNEPTAIAARLSDTDISFKLYDRKVDLDTYLGIDLVPIDGIPASLPIRELHFLKLNFLRMCFRYSIFSYGVTTNEMKKGKRQWYKKLLVFIGTKLPVEKIFKKEKWSFLYDKEMQKYSYDECETVGTLSGPHGKKSIFPKAWYGDGKYYSFEGMQVKGVAEYDLWLTQLYGDYMTPPKNSERVAHAAEITDSKTDNKLENEDRA